MNFISSLLILALSVLKINSSLGLFQDDAGKNDFVLPTAGHGVLGVQTAFLSSDQQAVITSSSSPTAFGLSEAGCYLASRRISDGLLMWRRNVCSQSSMNHYGIAFASMNSVSHSTGKIYTLDEGGALRTWNDSDGSLISETRFPGEMKLLKPRLAMLKDHSYVASVATVNEDDTVNIFNIQSNHWDDIHFTAKDILSQSRAKNSDRGAPTILAILPASSTDEDPMKLGYIVAGFVSSNSLEQRQMQSPIPLVYSIGIASIMKSDDGTISLKEYKPLSYDRNLPLDVKSIEASKDSQNGSSFVARYYRSDDSVQLFNLNKKSSFDISVNQKMWRDEYENAPRDISSLRSAGVGYICDGFVSVLHDAFVHIYHANSKSLVGSFGGDIEVLNRIKCSMNTISLITNHRGGMSSLIKVNTLTGNVETLWVAEEGLDLISSAVILDKVEVHLPGNDSEVEDEEAALMSSLNFLSRIGAQTREFANFAQGGFLKQLMNLVGFGDKQAASYKDTVFGLNKIVVTLSSNFHKVIGLDTETKGKVIWKLDLNSNAAWHKIVHGTSSNRASAFGLGIHHPHSPELLILSQLDGEVNWKCVDGVKGKFISEDTISLSAPISQIIPLHGHSHGNGGCKQFAALILDDDSVVLVANVTSSSNEMTRLVQSGLYAHTIDRETGIFRSVKVDDDGSVEVVGQTQFDPQVEQIINVVYPQRNEVVQSPSTILGDESLLLKYLNPHLCVIITESTPQAMMVLDHDKEESQDPLLKALSKSKGKQVQKPLGATKPGESPQVQSSNSVPTLFVNVIDTVSGAVLSRVSHSHFSSGTSLDDQKKVPAIISENWIIYAFENAISRRTEIGVLTLHEGMIDKYGISAFSSPEQQQLFSSLMDEKPIVLTKTFTVNYPISSLGVSITKGGISSKTILVGTGVEGKILKIDRRLLDPRRPFGEPKKSEKEEGLMQYTPLLPLIPMHVQSYFKVIENPSLIVSASTNLESQTCILACGGPDIFFTRFAPSRDFDSLPETFNKLLIVVVVLGLYVLMNVIKRMGDKKNVKLFWS